MTITDSSTEGYGSQRGDNISRARLKGRDRHDLYLKIKKLVQKGRAANEIGKDLHITDVTVYNTAKRYIDSDLLSLLKKNGVNNRHKVKIPEEILEKAWDLSKKGFGIDTICKILKIRNIRDRLIKKYGFAQYALYHPKSRFTTGFNQRFYYITGDQEKYQSLGELLVGTILNANNVNYP